MRRMAFGLLTVLVVVLSACSTPQVPSSSPVAGGSGAGAQTSSAPKRITAAVASQAQQIASTDLLAGGGTWQGGDAIEELVNGGLSVMDREGKLRPQLAETVPSIENGGWRLLPDGRMELTWKLRPGILWHDGTPFTTADLLFTYAMNQDRELPVFREAALDVIEDVAAPDERTVVVMWKQPYISADRMFSRLVAMPRPQHILGSAFAENKPSVLQHAYWGEAYVGTGPFKVRQWAPGSHLTLDANERYVLGRPHLDEIEIRFIPDPNTLIANLLAGEVELTMGRALTLAQAMQIRERWTSGKIAMGYKNWIVLHVQSINPDPPLLREVQFRRALVHALDRQQLVDELEYGMTSIAHFFLSPTESLFKEVEGSAVKYDFDPRRAAQMIQELGYTRGGDGLFRDAAGRELPLEVRTNTGHEERVLAIADQYRSLGLAATSFVVPDARRRDQEYNYTYPGVRLWRQPNDPEDLARYHSREAPRPENRFFGGNYSRYMNPALDALIDRYMGSMAVSDRAAVLRDIVRHQTEQAVPIGVYYNVEPAMIGSRLRNVTARETGQMTEAWNAHEWERP